MNTHKKIAACFGAVLIACILFWVWLLAGHSQANDRFHFDGTDILATELQKDGGRQTYSTVLPEEFETSQSILFKSTHAAVEVLLDDTVVYTYGTEKPAVGRSPGVYWHVVTLPAESAGRELVIRQTSVYATYRGADQDIYYGSRGDCILRLAGHFLPILILNFIMLVLGLISIILHLRTSSRDRMQSGSSFLWIGLLALIIAVWSLRQCGFLQFLFPYGQFLYFVDIHLLFLVAVPLNLFVYSISQTKLGKRCLWFVPVYLAGTVVGTALQAANIMDTFELLRPLNIFQALNAVYVFWASHREARGHEGSPISRFRIPLYTVMGFGVLEMSTYYIHLFDIMIFLPMGVMVFILMLIWQQVEEYYHTLEEQKLLYYEKLANTDMLTGAFNRNAYENRLRQLALGETDLNRYVTVMFDLNDLKLINDSFGHEKGDAAIRRCYDLILTAFGDNGNCYRIGGDEFLLLIADEADMEQKAAYFNELVIRDQERLEFPFDIALGYASFDPEQDRDLQNTIRRSDAMMYQDKKEKKLLQQENKGEKLL